MGSWMEKHCQLDIFKRNLSLDELNWPLIDGPEKVPVSGIP